MCQNPEHRVLLLALPSSTHICSFAFVSIQGFDVETSSSRSRGSRSTGLPYITMILINGPSSFSATECHLSLVERKSVFSSEERLLLIGHHNHICPKVNFHSATFLVTTSSNASEDLQSH